jgi:hypothetical protein
MQSVDAVLCYFHGVTLRGEPAVKGAGRQLVVLYHENPHAYSIPRDAEAKLKIISLFGERAPRESLQSRIGYQAYWVWRAFMLALLGYGR